MNSMAGSPDPVSEVREISISAERPSREIRARVYVPFDSLGVETLPFVLFVHGGGFVSGDLDTHDVLARAITNGARALVVSIEYRLAPEYPFPAGLEDCYAALKWIAKNASSIGGDARRIVLAGDSAGGNLATVTTILARDREGPPILGQWLMHPTLSNKMDTASWHEFGATNFPTKEINEAAVACYVPEDISPYSPLVAPLWADLSKLPPAFIQVGSNDPLRDENTSYANKFLSAGGSAEVLIYEGQQHGFIQYFKDKTNNSEGETALRAGLLVLANWFAVK